jgi:hypothetical protein
MVTGESQSTSGKTCPSATLSTENSTWTSLGINPGLDGERLVTEPHQFICQQCCITSAVDNIVQQHTAHFTISDPMSDLVQHYDFPVPLLFLM